MGMTADDLREAYLSFFEGKGHTRYPSDSLVPANDPTLLFTGAGMNQFKEMFLGVGNLPFRRAVTSQKCFRTGDLEKVGRTEYHQTLFEMLGNFSFGDYFKREAIAWQWEFLTRRLGLPENRLRVSVYEDDDEAFAVWRDAIGLAPDRIWRMDAQENFWPANAPAEGPNGPCGPCSEIFFDRGSPGAEGDPEADRYCEIGNIVFTQFERVGKDRLEPLAQRNIDTGMGFERILAVLNGVRSNFETELFVPLIERTAGFAGLAYRHDHPEGHRFRRIADHARAAVFLIADGVKPGNEGRGYVVRRVIRRAIRDGIALGIEDLFLHRLVGDVVATMGRAYPEVATAESAARAFLQAEERKFRETFETGMALLDRALEAHAGDVLPGETAFVLYDTHGFPLELCEEICAERGRTVDRAGFERCMKRQRERSRAGSAIAGEVFVATALTPFKRELGATVFRGYDTECEESPVRILLRGGASVTEVAAGDGEVELIAEATPFYAESGGQIGDAGVIAGPRGRLRVRDTRRIDGFVVHYGEVEQGALAVGEAVTLEVDRKRRAAIRRNHSATHLLHAALRTLLGPHVAQAGSLVAPDRLRFDFTHPEALPPAALADIESWVNEEVLLDSDVVTAVMDLEQAKRAGAMALFGEKYDERVRVVRIGEHSLELCGGTHVGSSAEIGACLLTHESSVAAGVRRIEMVTGGGAVQLAREQRGVLRGLAESLRTAPDELGARLASLQAELRELRRAAAARRREQGLSELDGLLGGAAEAGGITVVAGVVDEDDPAALRTLSDAVRRRRPDSVVLLAGRGERGAALLATASQTAVAAGIKAGDVLRELADRLGGKGGGRPGLAQGRAPVTQGLEPALEAARKALLDQLAAV